jgi:exodeoxyribonuclease VII small subunit
MKKTDFEDAMKKLEKIVEDLEKRELTLEESLEKFEEGLALGKKCKEILDKAEMRVKKVIESDEGELEEKDVSDEFQQNQE